MCTTFLSGCLMFLFLGTTNLLWLTEIDYDFGQVTYDTPVNIAFEYQNTGSDSLYIDNVRTSCGCTTSEWSYEAVAPDSIGVIHVSYDSRDMGKIKKKIKVYFRSVRKPHILTIEGTVIE
ncbi:MAG: DUF1573 domain-containing protein [Bacteroidota bacterium]